MRMFRMYIQGGERMKRKSKMILGEPIGYKYSLDGIGGGFRVARILGEYKTLDEAIDALMAFQKEDEAEALKKAPLIE